MLQMIPLQFCLSRVMYDLLNTENRELLLNGMNDLMAEDTGMAEVPSAFIASVLTNRVSQAHVISEKVQWEEPAAVVEDWGRGYFRELIPYKFMGPGRLHPRWWENQLMSLQGCLVVFDYHLQWRSGEFLVTGGKQVLHPSSSKGDSLASVARKSHSESSRNMFLGT